MKNFNFNQLIFVDPKPVPGVPWARWAQKLLQKQLENHATSIYNLTRHGTGSAAPFFNVEKYAKANEKWSEKITWNDATSNENGSHKL